MILKITLKVWLEILGLSFINYGMVGCRWVSRGWLRLKILKTVIQPNNQKINNKQINNNNKENLIKY